ncbi:MAG: ABC transporter permease [Pyrinomonadaceae bacterium]
MNGASWREILFGKTLGICAVAFALLAPVTALTLLLWVILSGWQIGADSLFRVSGLLASYTIYFIVCAFIAVLVSAFHKTSRAALTTLVVVWILFCIVMPKATQTLGSKLYPTPSKSQFEAGLEEEISQEGDGHNPDDPKFVKLREDTLREYNVARVEDLPFNYGGLVMAEAERISSKVFREHYEDLIETFRRQNRVTEIASFVNPYLAIRNLSMSLSGSDFDGYADFQTQAETYRYNLIQKMNELHKNEIKYENDRAQRVSSADFKNLPPFVFAAAARF